MTVEYANRLTSSGVYVHQALESAWGAVGRVNVSHGTVGLLQADAAWFFSNMKTGDLVQTLNAVRRSLRTRTVTGAGALPRRCCAPWHGAACRAHGDAALP
ncbi:L,D-transpeptidase [Micrococcaceae bacterium Sec5.7]